MSTQSGLNAIKGSRSTRSEKTRFCININDEFWSFNDIRYLYSVYPAMSLDSENPLVYIIHLVKVALELVTVDIVLSIDILCRMSLIV